MESALPRPNVAHSNPFASHALIDFLRVNRTHALSHPSFGAYAHINQEHPSGRTRWVYIARAREGRWFLSWRDIWKERHIRRKLIPVIISAIFLVLVLGLYIAFAISNSHLGQELHILLIFMILILAIVLCHSMIRFSLAVFRGPNASTNRIPNQAGPHGYAQPERPIPVTLVADEEMLTESNGAVREKVTVPPPAYGLWRSSVRINPDLLYWQRVNNSPRRASEDPGSKPTSPRPPSYTSDNGIDYVVEAQPRPFSEWPTPEASDRR
ncbi:hypothetical protein BDV59DRAFT_44497 [Aspergillus ambiguus]|uniref:uncharacterized protein n=1 Tax=Aspergillus ambiguus TaxID=176160 RepID=UPI003CCD9C21